MSDPDLAAWAAGAEKPRQCHTCRNTEACEKADKALAALAATRDQLGLRRATRTIRETWELVRAAVPTYSLSVSAFETHLRTCRKAEHFDLWGRK